MRKHLLICILFLPVLAGKKKIQKLQALAILTRKANASDYLSILALDSFFELSRNSSYIVQNEESKTLLLKYGLITETGEITPELKNLHIKY
jgi:hypothetical protein